MHLKRLIHNAFRVWGFDIVRYRRQSTSLPPGLSGDDRAIIERIAGYTMTSIERQAALIHAVRYLVRHELDGCLVECGVWRGGSSMAVALTARGESRRKLCRS